MLSSWRSKAKSEEFLLGLKYDRIFERKNVDYLL